MSELQPTSETIDTYLIGTRTMAEWHAWLTHDQRTGRDSSDDAVPCSRYGTTAAQTAWWAIALGAVYQHGNGPADDDEAAMDWYQELAVNDADDVLTLVKDFEYVLPADLKQRIDLEAAGGTDV